MRVVVGETTALVGQVVGSDTALDLAVVKIAGSSWPFIPITPIRPQAGEEVTILGYSNCDISDVQVRHSQGKVVGSSNYAGLEQIQTDVAINSRNSGGAAITARGEYIGVPTWRLEGGVQDYGFFIGFFNTYKTIETIIASSQINPP